MLCFCDSHNTITDGLSDGDVAQLVRAAES